MRNEHWSVGRFLYVIVVPLLVSLFFIYQTTSNGVFPHMTIRRLLCRVQPKFPHQLYYMICALY